MVLTLNTSVKGGWGPIHCIVASGEDNGQASLVKKWDDFGKGGGNMVAAFLSRFPDKEMARLLAYRVFNGVISGGGA